MKATITDNMLYLNREDVPKYQPHKSKIRNNYFWALKSICDYAPSGSDWEFSQEVWVALSRMLLFFYNSGYLGYSETILEFDDDTIIPEILRSVSTKL